MDRQPLTATGFFAAHAKVALYVAAAIVVALRPKWLVDLMGSEPELLGWALLAAFFALAVQSWALSQARLQMAELMEALNQLLYGKDYRRDREAIEILLVSLEGADATARKTAYTHLVRLTGQNFADDPKVWRSWWEANKKRFERRRDGAT